MLRFLNALLNSVLLIITLIAGLFTSFVYVDTWREWASGSAIGVLIAFCVVLTLLTALLAFLTYLGWNITLRPPSQDEDDEESLSPAVNTALIAATSAATTAAVTTTIIN